MEQNSHLARDVLSSK